jgi:hypothetical protein
MGKRILLGGLLGGVALFFWGFVSHTVLPLGEVGVQNLPQDHAVIDSMKAAIPGSGFYFFPPVNASGGMVADQVNGPHGILIYHPSGASAMMTRQLITEFILNVIQALIAAYLLSLATGLAKYTSRVGLVLLLGVLSGIATNVEYWNWYGFPANYMLGTIVDEIIGFLVVGLVVAALVKPRGVVTQIATAKAARVWHGRPPPKGASLL